MQFSIKDFFRKFEQIYNFLWIYSHLLKKSLTKHFIFCAVRMNLNLLIDLPVVLKLNPGLMYFFFHTIIASLKRGSLSFLRLTES